jgi:ligand-binding SRPBCC domain-containing protein
MPTHESVVILPAAPAQVFALLRRPAVLVQLALPEMRMQVESGPDELVCGSELTLCGRRWGMTHRVVSAVTACEPDTLLILEQRRGPFRKWLHTSRLTAMEDGGTRLVEIVDYERPGGLLGLTITAARVESELEALFTHRRQRLLEMLTVRA